MKLLRIGHSGHGFWLCRMQWCWGTSVKRLINVWMYCVSEYMTLIAPFLHLSGTVKGAWVQRLEGVVEAYQAHEVFEGTTMSVGLDEECQSGGEKRLGWMYLLSLIPTPRAHQTRLLVGC